MTDIKRYPNRKLYNTQTRQYITLQGIAGLIRQGEEVRVTDHQSGEDLTSLTLTQIILEQEKRQNGLLSNSFLTDLIRSGGERLSSIRRESLSLLEEQLERRLRQLQIPTHADLQELDRRLEELSQKLEQVTENRTKPPGKPRTPRGKPPGKHPMPDEVEE